MIYWTLANLGLCSWDAGIGLGNRTKLLLFSQDTSCSHNLLQYRSSIKNPTYGSVTKISGIVRDRPMLLRVITPLETPVDKITGFATMITLHS